MVNDAACPESLEVIRELSGTNKPIKAALFDFDGTISVLRQGWEDIMEPFMLEMVCGGNKPEDTLVDTVRQYIDTSTGIQTIYQMQWLAEMAAQKNLNAVVHDDWWYKDEYNRRLIERVKGRINSLKEHQVKAEAFMIQGAVAFLQALTAKGVALYLASGTDHEDVVKEAEVLGVRQYFKQIAGAPHMRKDCSKEAVIRELLRHKGMDSSEVLVIGDGKVEIGLGVEAGAVTLGLATDEVRRFGINVHKRERLIKAGAHAIAGDFRRVPEILSWLNMAD